MNKKSGIQGCQHTETEESYGFQTIRPFYESVRVLGTHTKCSTCGIHLNWDMDKDEPMKKEIELHGQLPKTGWNLRF